ncbi:hypothetical protein JAAARDRAFT_199664 [Jaapia argillacea MUCL 33604]|uniref:DUF6533 domain-containing protein n=1 Tax=Jaapia argillacea MUCL 33604 TaxID=933084 RepID=A0A067P7E3_9AGAM|nr:hypothetical protein JAAARDRAFT_199664 [Jaapia argillacea MUCL 33604]
MPGLSEAVFISYLNLTHLEQLSATLAALYDHVISIDQELELIWGHPGRSAKIFYVLIRYGGDFLVVWLFASLIRAVKSDSACVLVKD